MIYSPIEGRETAMPTLLSAPTRAQYLPEHEKKSLPRQKSHPRKNKPRRRRKRSVRAPLQRRSGTIGSKEREAAPRGGPKRRVGLRENLGDTSEGVGEELLSRRKEACQKTAIKRHCSRRKFKKRKKKQVFSKERGKASGGWRGKCRSI